MTHPLAEDASRLSALLEEWGRGAAVIGGMAMISRVRVRPTNDIDVIVEIPEGRMDDLLALAERHGYRLDPATTRELAAAGLARLESPGGGAGIDIVAVDTPFLSRVVDRATPVAVPDGATLPVATLEDLLVLKLDAGRPIDLDDVLAIKDGFGDVLDMTYVREAAMELGLTRPLELVFGAVADRSREGDAS